MGLRSAAKSQRALIADAVRTRLWPVPAVAVIFAGVTGVASVQLDRAVDRSLPTSASYLLFGGGPAAAREVLGAVASSLITVTSLTFSLTLVTLQLASSQFSPRLLRTFARDRFVQRTLALFLATFVYALTVLRTVRDGIDGDVNFVPKISVTTAYLLAVVSVIGLVLFLAHLVREIRVETMLKNVFSDAIETVNSLLPERDSDDPRSPTPMAPPHAVLVSAPSSGFLVRVDEDALLGVAVDADATIAVDRAPGEWVSEGTPVAAVWPTNPGAIAFDPDQLAQLKDCVAAELHVGSERTPFQDIGYAIRQLADVANKALSPGINDPTTAIHALGHTSALLCELSRRELGAAVLHDENRVARVVLRRPDLGSLLDLAVSQPRRYGAGDAAVMSRLFSLLQELAWCAVEPADKRAVAGQLSRLRQTVSQQDFDDIEHAELERAGVAVDAALVGDWV